MVEAARRTRRLQRFPASSEVASTLRLDFEGWCQCRLATDPDLYDHPRGLSGWTFAVGSEPNRDRIIQLQAPVAPCSFGPTIGLTVRTAQFPCSTGRSARVATRAKSHRCFTRLAAPDKHERPRLYAVKAQTAGAR